MTCSTYAFGELIRFTGTFRKQSDQTLVDPTGVLLRITIYPNPPVELTLAGGQIVRDSLGVFHADYTPVAAGNGAYSWEGTGAVVAANRNVPITIEETQFST